MDIEQERLALARLATRILRHGDFAGSLVPSARTCREAVHRVVLAALPTDRLGTVLDRVEAYGESVTLVVHGEDEDGGLAILSFQPSSGEALDECPVHDDAEIGLLLTFMREHRHSIRLCRMGEYEMELVEDGRSGEPTPA